jgi:hypothetical protein
MADKGWSGALDEIVIRLQREISTTGKAPETSKSFDQRVMSRQVIASCEEVPARPRRDVPDGSE